MTKQKTMQSHDDLLTRIVLAIIFLGTCTLFFFLLRRADRCFWSAMLKLRDRLDRSDNSRR